jgi:WD40 repeat protein
MLFDSGLELASLLAVKAYRTSPTKEATASLYNAADAGLTGSFRTDAEAVASVAFNPDGTLLATGGAEPRARLWDIATGRELHTLDHIFGGVFSVRSARTAP